MTDQDLHLQRRIDDYLEGRMEVSETRRFEADLIDPELRRALAHSLLLRDHLQHAGPTVPKGLAERILRSLPMEGLAQERDRSRAQALLEGFSWSWRGPQQVLAAPSALDGMGAMRFALGPLALRKRNRDAAPARAKKPLWRRLLRRSLRRSR